MHEVIRTQIMKLLKWINAVSIPKLRFYVELFLCDQQANINKSTISFFSKFSQDKVFFIKHGS